MDNNNPASQAPTVNPPVANVVNNPIATPVQVPPSKSGNKMVLLFVIGLIAIAVVVGGIYFFLSKQQEAADSQPQAVVTQTPVPVAEVDLESELNNIDVDASIDSDFSSVDQDLQQL